MIAVVQRVKKASVKVDDEVAGSIENGLLVLLGIGMNDDRKVIEWVSNKIVNLRIFSDDSGKMNNSVLDIGGSMLLVSNFTLYGDTSKGFRPSFSKAAPPDLSEKLYIETISFLRDKYEINIQTGIFGAMMDVELINDGPVTVTIRKEN